MPIKAKICNKVSEIPSEYSKAYTSASDYLDACLIERSLQDPRMSSASSNAVANDEQHIEIMVTG